jgi:hypothetical protein
MKTGRGAEVQLSSFLTSALNGGDQLHAPAGLPPGEKKPALLIEQEAVWIFWRREKKFLSLPGIEPRIVKSVA